MRASPQARTAARTTAAAGYPSWPTAWRRERPGSPSLAARASRQRGDETARRPPPPLPPPPQRDDDNESDRRPSPPPSPLVGSLLAGATLGPLLDGIHSSVGLQIYDLWPADLGPLHTSAAVPALLSAFYLTLTLLDDAAERLSGNDSTPNPPTPLTIAACYASLAGGLALSAFLHANEVPPSQIAAALAIFAGFNFAAFDRTRRGLALALLCAVVAPLAEAQLMARFGTWHYPRADIEVPVLLSGLAFGSEAMTTPGSVGFISWVPLCYFFYAPSVLLLGRKLRAAERQRKRREG